MDFEDYTPISVNVIVERQLLVLLDSAVCEDAHADVVANSPFRDIAIRIARSVDPEHSPEIFGQAILADETPTKGLISACPPIDDHHSSEPIEEHEVRVLLMRKYNAIEELNDDEFCDVLPQFSTCKSIMDSDNMSI